MGLGRGANLGSFNLLYFIFFWLPFLVFWDFAFPVVVKKVAFAVVSCISSHSENYHPILFQKQKRCDLMGRGANPGSFSLF